MNPEAEHAQHRRDADAAHAYHALNDAWLRLWDTHRKNATRTSAFGLRYDAALDAGMARLDAEWEAARNAVFAPPAHT